MEGAFDTLDTGLFIHAVDRDVRHLTSVVKARVHAFERFIQYGIEAFIAGGTAETAVLAEVSIREAAGRTGDLPIRTGVDRIKCSREHVGEGEALWVGHALGLGTFLAEVDLVNLVVDDLGQVDSGLVVTGVALDVLRHEWVSFECLLKDS